MTYRLNNGCEVCQTSDGVEPSRMDSVRLHPTPEKLHTRDKYPSLNQIQRIRVIWYESCWKQINSNIVKKGHSKMGIRELRAQQYLEILKWRQKNNYFASTDFSLSFSFQVIKLACLEGTLVTFSVKPFPPIG